VAIRKILVGFILEKRIPLSLLIFLAWRFFLHLEKCPFGPKEIAEVSSLLVSDPFCLRLFALVICFLVVEIAIIATAQIRLAMRTGILSLNLVFYLHALSAFPALHNNYLTYLSIMYITGSRRL
jgi:hypothetical protein